MVNTEKEELYGTWHLVSYVERTGNGEETESFGQAPRGILNYGRDGRMFAMIVKDERPKIAGSREPTARFSDD
jgi:acetoacetate decarboxylase